MPDPTSAKHLLDPLLRHIAERITPLFEVGGTGKTDALETAISALAAYDPRSRADFVNIARILAFSLASLAALGLAAADDLPPAQKMRYFGRANALNRSADQTERMMMQRRRGPNMRPSAPPAAPLEPEMALSPQDEAALDAAVEEAMALCRSTAATTPARKAQPQSAQTQPRQAETGLYTSGPSPRPPTPYRQTLLQGSAMPRVINDIRQQPPPS